MLTGLEIALVLFVALFGFTVGFTGFWRSATVLYLSVAMVSVLTGAQFPSAAVAVDGDVTSTASRLYTADLIGSGVGSLLTAAFLVPTVGVRNTLLLLFVLKLLSLARLLKSA